MKATIAVLPGDGVGPEVTACAVGVLQAVARRDGHNFEFIEAGIGGHAIDRCGDPLPAATLDICRSADAVLLGAVGGPKWSDPNAEVTPEQGLLRLREALGVFANLRPVRPHPRLHHVSPVKSSLLRNVDLVVVRELTGGIYFGEKHREDNLAWDRCEYTVPEIERIVVVAGELAMSRRRKLTSVDKANVLATSKLWRTTTDRVVRERFPELELEHLLVDAAAMHLIARPADFDVVVTENLFGDILTDEASILCGSLGLLPSASVSGQGPGLFEPIHGSAPDIAGRGVANPVGAIACAAMLLDHGLGLGRASADVMAAVDAVIDEGVLTRDVSGARAGANTRTVATAIIERLNSPRSAATDAPVPARPAHGG